MNVAERMRNISNEKNNAEKVLNNILKSIEDMAREGKTHTYFDSYNSFWNEGLNNDNYATIKRKLSDMGFEFRADGFMTMNGYVNHTVISWG